MPFPLPRICALLAIVAATMFSGCGTASVDKEHASKGHHEGDGHGHTAEAHSEIGPHGGHLIELGSNEAFHAELLHDDTTHRVTVYILDGKAKADVPIPQPELVVNIVSAGNPKQFKLMAAPLATELRDTASCFQLENEELCTALDATDCKGRLAVNIDGKQYVGEIQHHDHDHK
jgi:hypothetical protein